MDYIFILKTAILIGLFFLTRYVYIKTDWHKRGSSKKEDRIMYLTTSIFIVPIFLAFGVLMVVFFSIPDEIINLTRNNNHVMQVLTLWGYIIFCFGFLIWKQVQDKKKNKKSKERDEFIEEYRYLERLVSKQENEIEELKSKLNK